MSTNDSNKNYINGRSPIPNTRHADPGPYLARVVSHLDNKFMGALQVQLIKTMSSGDQRDENTSLITAFYASPFFGVTSYVGLGQNDNYQSTQQSYGFWAVPPDVDTKVLVTFVEGRRDICFWFACVPDDFMNFMVPDGRPATVLTSPGSRPSNAEGKKLPVGEYNKRTINPQGNNQPTTYVKPVNQDFVDRLTEEGLLEDDFRGLTTSSARREVPSAVFGINTPGPLDKRPEAPVAPRGARNSVANVHWSRLGGHSIVMDDGDDKILRRRSAADSPPEYISVETDGLPDDPEAVTRPANELFRIRTRTGHQILLHNTEDLIYISNSRGTAWIELTSNGKIDIYAQDSISMHTEGEFNVTADSNINLTAGGDINLNATKDIKNSSRNFDTTAGGRVAFKLSDDFSVESGDFVAIRASSDIGITSATARVNITGDAGVEINGDSDVVIISDSGAVRITGNTNVEASAGTDILLNAPEIHDASNTRFIDADNIQIMAWSNIYMTGQSGVDLYTNTLKIEGQGSIDIKSEGQIICTTDGTIKFKAASTFEVGSFNFSVDAGNLEHIGIGKFQSSLYCNKIWAPQAELNFIRNNVSVTGAGAVTPVYNLHNPGNAAEATPSSESDVPTPPAKTEGPEPTVPVPAARTARVPQHEPWFQHENLNPQGYAVTRANTESTDTYVYPIPDPFILFRSSTFTPTEQVQHPGQDPGYNVDNEPEETSIGSINFNEFTENASAVVAFFEANGYERWAGAGIAGALQWESGVNINPGAYLAPNNRSNGLLNIAGNLGLGARGICQWRDAGRRLTRVERFLGKPILTQPEMNVNAPGYERLRNERLPTQNYRSMTFDRGVRIAPFSATLEDQLRAMVWELDNDENATKRAILAVNSGSDLLRARRVAEIMNDLYLRSGNPTIPVSGNTRVPVKTLRANSAEEIYQSLLAGRSTDPVTDPREFPAPPVIGADPAAGSRPRDAADPADRTTSSSALGIITGTAATRQNPIRTSFATALSRAARDTGIDRIQGTSFANECLRRINTASALPIENWGTFPSRSDGPGADMRLSGGLWQKLNPNNNEWELRPNGAGWRTGTERHDTGLAIDCYLQVRRNGNLVTLLPTNQRDRNQIEEFLIAFARYGGRACGVGSSGSQDMPNGLFHLDMLGGIIIDPNRFIRPTGFVLDPAVGWNSRPSAWSYGGGEFNWALSALIQGYNEVS